MDIYHVWFDPKPGLSDVELSDRVHRYLSYLKDQDKIRGYRVTRKKLGFAPPGLGEFHVTIEVRDLSELEAAFQHVASRSGAVEGLHASVNQHVTNFASALYRDFPDAVRVRGEERF